MTERIKKLRDQSLEAIYTISAERAFWKGFEIVAIWRFFFSTEARRTQSFTEGKLQYEYAFFIYALGKVGKNI